MKFFLLLFLCHSTFAQMLETSLPKEITVKGNVYTFGPLSETDLNQKPIVPTILKNRQLQSEYLCMKFFNNQIRNEKGIIDLSKPGNYLYARFNWIKDSTGQVKPEIINKKLYYDSKTQCHFIGNYPNHELYKVDGKTINNYEAKDLQILAYSEADGGLSVNMGKDLSLVKACEIREPIQDESYFKYEQMPSMQNGFINCQARFRCHSASSTIKFNEIQENSGSINFEFNGYCITKKEGKLTCAKVHPDQCADAYMSAVMNQEIQEKKEKENTPVRFKKNSTNNKGGSGAQM